MKLLILLSVICTVYIAKSSYFDPILLNNVSVLTFQKNQYTRGRSPLLQLVCIGGDAKSYSNTVENVQCYNMGMLDNNSPNWKCETNLATSLKLGKVEVVCEKCYKCNHIFKDNNYIFKGSCRLEYNLEFTNKTVAFNDAFNDVFNQDQICRCYCEDERPFNIIEKILVISTMLGLMYLYAPLIYGLWVHYPQYL